MMQRIVFSVAFGHLPLVYWEMGFPLVLPLDLPHFEDCMLTSARGDLLQLWFPFL